MTSRPTPPKGPQSPKEPSERVTWEEYLARVRTEAQPPPEEPPASGGDSESDI